MFDPNNSYFVKIWEEPNRANDYCLEKEDKTEKVHRFQWPNPGLDYESPALTTRPFIAHELLFESLSMFDLTSCPWYRKGISAFPGERFRRRQSG